MTIQKKGGAGGSSHNLSPDLGARYARGAFSTSDYFTVMGQLLREFVFAKASDNAGLSMVMRAVSAMTMHPLQSARALLILGILSSPIPVLGDEPTADESAEVTLQFLKPCDALNRRLYLENKYTYRTYAVTVHWNAAGGKELSERLIVSPNSRQEVGCAANARIVDALPMEF